jgi:hypothetical protein
VKFRTCNESPCSIPTRNSSFITNQANKFTVGIKFTFGFSLGNSFRIRFSTNKQLIDVLISPQKLIVQHLLDRAQEFIRPNTALKAQRIGQHVTHFMPIFIPWNKQSSSNELNDGPLPVSSLSLKNDQLVQKYSRRNKNQSVEVERCHSLLCKAISSIAPKSGIKRSFISIKKSDDDAPSAGGCERAQDEWIKRRGILVEAIEHR